MANLPNINSFDTCAEPTLDLNQQDNVSIDNDDGFPAIQKSYLHWRFKLSRFRSTVASVRVCCIIVSRWGAKRKQFLQGEVEGTKTVTTLSGRFSGTMGHIKSLIVLRSYMTPNVCELSIWELQHQPASQCHREDPLWLVNIFKSIFWDAYLFIYSHTEFYNNTSDYIIDWYLNGECTK